MDNLDDSENNAKISDSAYSNSCSNSQSRRSHSSKSTHSGSSGSSGYGGKPSTSGSSNKLEQTSKKDKESKKKKKSQTEVKALEELTVEECRPPEPIPLSDAPEEVVNDVIENTSMSMTLPEIAVESQEGSETQLTITTHQEDMQVTAMQTTPNFSLETSCQVANIDSAGFSCAISMADGVVMYTTQNVSTNLGFPKDMWVGRSFIDFVHPKDRNTFASQITNGLATPRSVNDVQEKVLMTAVADCKMVCRIRRYRSLNVSFGVKEQSMGFMPFLLNFFFKDMSEDDGKIVFLIIQATPIHSDYKIPNECKVDATPFVIRHSAAGILEYIDIESVPYLGYVPQDIHNMDALLMYHPDDLPYLKRIYEAIVKEGNVSKTLPYRMMTQNGDYVKLETEWSSIINPWSMKLELVIGKHQVVEGPTIPDVFQLPLESSPKKNTQEDKSKIQLAEKHRENIHKILKEDLTKPAEKVKKQINKRCQDLAQFMESLLEEQAKPEEELRLDIQDAEPDLNYERDSVMLGGISPHHDHSDSKSTTSTPLSYNQLNYNDNLQRYFDSHQNYCFDEENSAVAGSKSPLKLPISNYLFSSLQEPADINDISNAFSSNAGLGNSPTTTLNDSQKFRLTETLLTKHNNEMEKELVKTHRETRCVSKSERAIQSRQKKKEHLARCNASYQPTEAGTAQNLQSHGVKRPSTAEEEISQKYQCSNSRKARRLHNSDIEDSPLPTTTTTTNTLRTYYYPPSSVPTTGQMLNSSTIPHNTPVPQQMHYTSAPMPWVYPQPVYTPYIYQGMFDLQQQQQVMMPQSNDYSLALNPLALPNNNYVQACKSSMELQPYQALGSPASEERIPAVRPKKKSIYEQLCKGNLPSVALDRSTETVTETMNQDVSTQRRSEPSGQSGQTSDETMDKTDGESSYSTFYSSFFKTESGSAEDSSEPKKARMEPTKKNPGVSFYTYEQQHSLGKGPSKRMNPPWVDKVSMTPELVYKYQIKTKSKEEVLKADLLRMKNLEQPALVNEQLEQLYLDLHLQGAASKLTLEEGVTSSSSSGEDSFRAPKPKTTRRKREYSQLNLIYEADAPLPPPECNSLCAESN